MLIKRVTRGTKKKNEEELEVMPKTKEIKAAKLRGAYF